MLEPDALRARLRREAAEARLDERRQLDDLQLIRERTRVDARKLEQILDERRQTARLLLERREVLGDVRELVLDGLEHRRDRRDRRAQVVARGGDELTSRVEEALDVRRHVVERASE